MAQITIYLDRGTAALVKAAVKKTGASQSHWIAEAVRQRARAEWPAAVAALAGAWPDFPALKEIRKPRAADTARVRW